MSTRTMLASLFVMIINMVAFDDLLLLFHGMCNPVFGFIAVLCQPEKVQLISVEFVESCVRLVKTSRTTRLQLANDENHKTTLAYLAINCADAVLDHLERKTNLDDTRKGGNKE